jgi:hypothetical protein
VPSTPLDSCLSTRLKAEPLGEVSYNPVHELCAWVGDQGIEDTEGTEELEKGPCNGQRIVRRGWVKASELGHVLNDHDDHQLLESQSEYQHQRWHGGAEA